jgi:sulfonate transport system permease protein
LDDVRTQALKAVPSLAWVPLFILWFGIFEVSKVVLIAVGVFFPVYLNLVSGIRSTDRKLVEVGQINGLGRIDMVRRILAPAALPSYITGLRAGLALGWMFVIAAELMGRVFQEVAGDLPHPRRLTTPEFQAIKEDVTVALDLS